MKITDTTKSFLELFHSNKSATIDELQQYHAEYPEIFQTYFNGYCQWSEERLIDSLKRYKKKIELIQNNAAQLPAIVEEVFERMSTYFSLKPELEVRLFVGCFGSNAYVDHHCNLHFSVEMLFSALDCLKVLVAHEMAHAFHYLFLNEAKFDWSKIKLDGYSSLYFEGVATYVSSLVIPGRGRSIYFTYNESGDEWLRFSEKNKDEIIGAFSEDLGEWSMEKEREWFRLSGGKHFGYNRLGYFIGNEYIKTRNRSIKETMTFWVEESLQKDIQNWLRLCWKGAG